MENSEEIFQCLDDFSKRKPKTIPRELEEYLNYVARTGDPVYQWSVVKYLFKEKLLNVITDFYETSPGLDIPQAPNVDPFNYDAMKNSLVEKIDSFSSAPFTVQRISELLTAPRKQYNRIDKFMRAIEKNVLVVSTREPGIHRHIEQENGEANEPIVNGSDNNSDYNVDVEMEDMSWKENSLPQNVTQAQSTSSEPQISVDDVQARLQAKQNVPIEDNKTISEYESVTPPELNSSSDDNSDQSKIIDSDDSKQDPLSTDEPIFNNDTNLKTSEEPKPLEGTNKTETLDTPMVIPEIKIDDAEMTEEKINKESIKLNENQNEETVIESSQDSELIESKPKEETVTEEVNKPVADEQKTMEITSDDNQDVQENPALLISEESSSSCEITDGSSNSPKTNDELNLKDIINDKEVEPTIEPCNETPEKPSETEPTQEDNTEKSIDQLTLEQTDPDLPIPEKVEAEMSNKKEESLETVVDVPTIEKQSEND